MVEYHLGPGKKKLMTGTTVVFIDESGYSLIPFVTRTWAPTGIIPVVIHSFRTRRKLSAISGIAVRYRQDALETNLFFRLYPDKTIKGKEVVGFLWQLSQQIKGDIILVWDNLKAHRSRKVKKFLGKHSRFQAVPLPPYCPELNPDEGVWNWTKTKDLANICTTDPEDMVHHVRGSLRKMQRRKNLLRWCLTEAELTWDILPD